MPSIPPNANDSIDLGTLVAAVADDLIVGQRSEYAPTSGRVLEDSQTGAVYVGNGSAWIDIDADSGVTSPALNTDSAVIAGQEMVSDTDETLYLDPINGDDNNDGSQSSPLKTLSEAFDRAHAIQKHRINLDIHTVPSLPVTYSEDLVVDGVGGTGIVDSTEGGDKYIQVIGDSADNTNVEIDSAYLTGLYGTSIVDFQYITFNQDNPDDDESAAVSVDGTRMASLFDCRFASGGSVTNAVSVKHGAVKSDGCDFGNASNHGVVTKGPSEAQLINCTGDPGGDVLHVRPGARAVISQNIPSGSVGINGGQVYDKVNGKYLGIPRFDRINAIQRLTMENEDTGSLFNVVDRSTSNNNLSFRDPTGAARLSFIENNWETRLKDYAENDVFVAGASGNTGQSEIKDTNGVRVRVEDSGDVSFFDTSGALIAVLRESSGDLDITGTINENQSL